MLTQKFHGETQKVKFSWKNRLSNPGEFKAVFQVARKVSSRNFALYLKKNDCNHPRLGVIVAKRNVRKASARNLIKRVIRESFRFNQARLRGFDVIVVVYNAFGLLSRQEMHKAIEGYWARCKASSSTL